MVVRCGGGRCGGFAPGVRGWSWKVKGSVAVFSAADSALPSSLPVAPLVSLPLSVACQEMFTGMASVQPRVFSMQKIVEVADFNMDCRPRVVWAQVWDVLAKFFAKVRAPPSLAELAWARASAVAPRVCARARARRG